MALSWFPSTAPQRTKSCGDCATTSPTPSPTQKKSTRSSCWIGLHEKPGTGTVSTPQKDQKWLWLDGTTPLENKYTNWATWPGLGNGKGDGNQFFEPNNQKTAKSKGFNVRHAIMNQPEGKFSGKWYDKPSEFMAHALCEMDPFKKLNLKKQTAKLMKLGRSPLVPLVVADTSPLHK